MRFSVAEEDLSVLQLDNATVGDGHFEHVRSEVFEGGLRGAHGLAVDVLIQLPDLVGDQCKKPGLGHSVTEFRSIDRGEGPDGQVEVDGRGMPGAVLSGQGATWDYVVDVGVVVELTPPGVKDAEEAREVPANVLFVSGELFDSA